MTSRASANLFFEYADERIYEFGAENPAALSGAGIWLPWHLFQVARGRSRYRLRPPRAANLHGVALNVEEILRGTKFAGNSKPTRVQAVTKG